VILFCYYFGHPRAFIDHPHGDSMSNALSPEQMSAAKRLDEIAEILAAGLIRLRGRKSSPIFLDHGEISLDFSANQRGDATANGLLEADG
jgi:hypothetical protein